MTLSLSNLKPPRGSHHRRKRLGRGLASGHGAYSTRGIKGQRARQGGRKGLTQLGVRHFIMHLPKVRGFRSFKPQPQVVMLAALVKFDAGTKVTPDWLKQQGLIEDARQLVKVVGQGKVKQLQLSVHAITVGARAAVEAAGGSVELIPPRPAPKRGKK